MSPYIFLYFIILLFTLISYDRKISKSIIYFLFLCLFVFSAIRYDIGRDYDSYLTIFENPDKMQTSEKGFMLFNGLLKNLGFSVQSVIIVFSAITLIFAFLYIEENSSDKSLSIFIFFTFSPFYLGSLNTIRQALAIYVFLYSVKYIKSRKFVRYFLHIVAIAFFAHKSAVILIPLYFVLNHRWNNFFKLSLIIFSILITKILDLIIDATPYAIYLLGESGTNFLSPVFLVDFIVCFSIAFFLRKSFVYKEYYNIAFLSLCVLIMGVLMNGNPVFVLIARINEYFLASIIVLVPEIIKRFKSKQIIYSVCILGFSLIYILSICINGEANQNTPYKMYFGIYEVNWSTDFIYVILFTFIAALLFGYSYTKKDKIAEEVK